MDDAKGRNELNSIKRELQSIINELDNIADGIRRNFTNIGEDKAASCVSKVADQYRTAKRKLDNIEIIYRGGGGSSAGGGSSRSF